MARRGKSREAAGQTLNEFVGAPPVEELGQGTSDAPVVAEGLRATATLPGIGTPSMGPGFERITERIFRVDVLGEFNELERGLKLDKPAHRADYSELVDALDEATDNARRAHLLVVNGKVALEAFELDTTILLADMRDQAVAALQREKAAGQRSKQITDADVEAWMSHRFPDQWRDTEERRAKAKRMCDHLERLSDLWKDRRSSLDTMVRGVRRV